MNKKILIPGVVLILIFSLALTYIFQRISKIETQVSSISNISNLKTSETQNITPVISSTDVCGDECKKLVNDLVSKAISTISGKTVIEKITTQTKASGTVYIPMGGTYTSTSTDWFTLDDTGIYIDLKHDYGEQATVSIEASLKVAHANGQAFIRLWDDTNKIAVNGSELSTVNNDIYQLVSSKNLPFWQGRNLYKLQIKSLNSFEVSVTGCKIKVEY